MLKKVLPGHVPTTLLLPPMFEVRLGAKLRCLLCSEPILGSLCPPWSVKVGCQDPAPAGCLLCDPGHLLLGELERLGDDDVAVVEEGLAQDLSKGDGGWETATRLLSIGVSTVHAPFEQFPPNSLILLPHSPTFKLPHHPAHLLSFVINNVSC